MTAVSRDPEALAERRYSMGRASLPTFSSVFSCQIFLQCYWSRILTFLIFLQKPFLIFCPFWLERIACRQMAQAPLASLLDLESELPLAQGSVLARRSEACLEVSSRSAAWRRRF